MTTPNPTRVVSEAEFADAETLIGASFPHRVDAVQVNESMSGRIVVEFRIINPDGKRETVEFRYVDTLEKATHRTIRRIAAILAEGV